MNIETDPVRHKYCHVCQDEHLACIPPRADPRPGERRQRTLGLASDSCCDCWLTRSMHRVLSLKGIQHAQVGPDRARVKGGGGAARLRQVPHDTKRALWRKYIAGYLHIDSFSFFLGWTLSIDNGIVNALHAEYAYGSASLQQLVPLARPALWQWPPVFAG